MLQNETNRIYGRWFAWLEYEHCESFGFDEDLPMQKVVGIM